VGGRIKGEHLAGVEELAGRGGGQRGGVGYFGKEGEEEATGSVVREDSCLSFEKDSNDKSLSNVQSKSG
jgi:hypothetical protein